MTLSAFFKAMPRGMAVAAGVVFLLLNTLGVWQLQRLHWKQQLIADMARTEAMAPVPAAEALAGSQPGWRRVTLPACAFDAKQLIYMHSEIDGQPGYRVLAACPLAQNQTKILVDLGFAAQRLDEKAAVHGTLDFFGFAPVGRLRPFEKANAVTPPNNVAADDWYWRSAADASARFGVTLRPDYFLVTDLAASHANIDGIIQAPLTAPLPNRHLEYALTWFALAWVLVAMFVAFVIQKAKRP